MQLAFRRLHLQEPPSSVCIRRKITHAGENVSIQANDVIYFKSWRVKLCFYLVSAEHGSLLLTVIPSNKLTASSCLSVHKSTSLMLRLIRQRLPLNQLWVWLAHFSFSLCDAFYSHFLAGFLRADQKPGGFWKAVVTRLPVNLPGSFFVLNFLFIWHQFNFLWLWAKMHFISVPVWNEIHVCGVAELQCPLKCAGQFTSVKSCVCVTLTADCFWPWPAVDPPALTSLLRS